MKGQLGGSSAREKNSKDEEMHRRFSSLILHFGAWAISFKRRPWKFFCLFQ